MEVNIKAEPGYRVEPSVVVSFPVPYQDISSFAALGNGYKTTIRLSIADANKVIERLSKAVVEAQR